MLPAVLWMLQDPVLENDTIVDVDFSPLCFCDKSCKDNDKYVLARLVHSTLWPAAYNLLAMTFLSIVVVLVFSAAARMSIFIVRYQPRATAIAVDLLERVIVMSNAWNSMSKNIQSICLQSTHFLLPPLIGP